eukprot:3322112-Amphidinium_carterae.1
MKRPFDHPCDMPARVVCNIEIRDIPTLPRNVDWCYPELNMYAQTGMFPLHFQKELFDYYHASIAHMCDAPDDYSKMKQHFESLDSRHGCPNNFKVPSRVYEDWH